MDGPRCVLVVDIGVNHRVSGGCIPVSGGCKADSDVIHAVTSGFFLSLLMAVCAENLRQTQMSTIFEVDAPRGLSVASADAESARNALRARFKLLETFAGTNLTETFASSIQDLWEFAGTSSSVDSVTLATTFPQWELKNHDYNLLRAWSCSVVEITDIRAEVSSRYGVSCEPGAIRDDLPSIETWMVTQATKARWNLTLFRVPSFDPTEQGTAKTVQFVLHDNSHGESIFAVSGESKLFKVLPPTDFGVALSQEVCPKLLKTRSARYFEFRSMVNSAHQLKTMTWRYNEYFAVERMRQNVQVVPNQDFKASNRFQDDPCILCHSSTVAGQALKLFKCSNCNKKFHHLCASQRGNDTGRCGVCSTSITPDKYFEEVPSLRP